MDGGLRAALLVSPPLHLRTAEFLSKRWGPPQTVETIVRMFAGHDLNHFQQIERILAAKKK